MTYTAHNKDVFKRELEDFAKRITIQLATLLRCVAQKLVDRVDSLFVPLPPYAPGGSRQYPAWEGQMHDATGVGVYIYGVLTSYIPTIKGRHPQYDKESGATNIIGSEYLMNALNAATTTFSKNIWIVLFCAVPYAARINAIGSHWGRGVGFFDKLATEMYNNVCNDLKAV